MSKRKALCVSQIATYLPTFRHLLTKQCSVCYALCRLTPTTWIVYGLSISQLDSTTTAMNFNGKVTTLRQFMADFFHFEKRMQWWCLLIIVAYIIGLRVAAVLALRYAKFLRR